MKAAVIRGFGDPEVLRVEDVEKCKIADEHQVLIAVEYTSINPIDWKTRRGNLRFILGFHFPKILGYDVSGRVAEVGTEVRNFKIGDRVATRLDNAQGGAYAEFAVAGEKVLTKIPENINFQSAAAVPLAGLTALQGLRNYGKLKSTERVLILGGAGGVGYFAIQIARILGASVHVVCSERSMEYVRTANPDKIIDYEKTDVVDLVDRYDVIFDTIGEYPYTRMKHLLLPDGRYITTLPRPKVLWHKFLGWLNKHGVYAFLMKSNGDDLGWMFDKISKDEIKVLIDSEFELSDIAKAHARSESGRAKGKIVVKI